MVRDTDRPRASEVHTMTLRTAMMALGAVLLLVAGVTLPAAAAGWGADQNQSTGTAGICPNSPDCDQTRARSQDQTQIRLQDQTGTASGYGLHKGPDGAIPNADETIGHYGKCSQLGENQRGAGAGAAGEGSGKCLGDCDQTQQRQQVQDGSCGGCQKSTS